MLVLHFFLVLFFYIEINITIFNSSVRLYKTRSKARYRANLIVFILLCIRKIIKLSIKII